MSITQRARIHYWLLVCNCYLLPLCSHSTPLPETQHPHEQLPADIANCGHGNIAELVKRSPVILKALGAHIFTDADPLVSNLWRTEQTSSGRNPIATATNEILITLTPETIYKGASLLKIAPIGESGARRSESAYQYEGQLNATLEPLSCFDGNVLKMLPAELIAFGELLTEQQLLQKQQDFPKDQQRQQSDVDTLRITINGLHRWSSQFENHIWKHLGWDDWSDFTLCSVTCGKGVQQRFRRCLLDNPMMNLNMNLDLRVPEEDEELTESRNVMCVEEDDSDENADEIVVAENLIAEFDGKQKEVRCIDNDDNNNRKKNNVIRRNHDIRNDYSNDEDQSKNEMKRKDLMTLASTEEDPVDAADAIHSPRHSRKQWPSYGDNDAEGEVMRIFEGEELISAAETNSASFPRDTAGNTFVYSGERRRQKTHKRKKSAKSFATLFCEGYNIEQRNCNTFECSDDINELLKFYKKIALADDVGPTSTSSFTHQPQQSNDWQTDSSPLVAAITEVSATSAGAVNAGPTTVFVPSPSTPSNMGYVKNWHSNSNFTIMITLRVKNDTKTSARIFSIRNATHNLYLEPSTEGLRLYLERDSTTEMLPVKFNLYDYRWHQVAISIQNGDFISIFVDCSWTNSFVVSKHLFSLPLDADIEIGRGFNGELQQLLVLPGNQERHQCSNVRTSINEVKRYIIDTFIGDDSN